MNKQQVANLLGLAQRAGRIISGEELVVKAIQEGKAKLVFLAHDAAKQPLLPSRCINRVFNTGIELCDW